jgi:hypothetical protein
MDPSAVRIGARESADGAFATACALLGLEASELEYEGARGWVLAEEGREGGVRAANQLEEGRAGQPHGIGEGGESVEGRGGIAAMFDPGEVGARNA